jgi:hypothetical protein
MGFILSENPIKSGLTHYHRMIKQTEKHMIIVTYKIRSRLFIDPKNALEDED